MLYVVSRAAGDAGAGADLISSETWRISTADRIIRGVAYTGSTAAGDTAVELFVGNLRIGTFFNSAPGAPQALRDTFAIGAYVPAGEILVANVTDAAATNPVYLLMEID